MWYHQGNAINMQANNKEHRSFKSKASHCFVASILGDIITIIEIQSVFLELAQTVYEVGPKGSQVVS